MGGCRIRKDVNLVTETPTRGASLVNLARDFALDLATKISTGYLETAGLQAIVHEETAPTTVPAIANNTENAPTIATTNAEIAPTIVPTNAEDVENGAGPTRTHAGFSLARASVRLHVSIKYLIN
eukprot:SAG11_NODE_6699_length_1263_cov_2.807560_2_plen_125_part_00